MKKDVILASLLGLMIVILASCTDDTGSNFQKTGNTPPEHVKLITDQSELASRLVFTNHKVKSKITRTITETPAPSIPEGALKLADQPTNWNNGVTLTPGNAYYIDKEWKGTISRATGAEGASTQLLSGEFGGYVAEWYGNQ